MTDEQDERINVTAKSYWIFIMRFFGGYLFWFFSITSMSVFLLAKMLADYTVGTWTMQPD